ncbi:sugar phosphate isomerase/epimerase family protein [Streptosporangium sp. NPDC051023]|uniref:sugar phosphate isomerase/epimerase family protein n=1 Tax=Streptosporangium sp. NPDC051023 TaxID=3155410 RepID=UPI00344EB7FF
MTTRQAITLCAMTLQRASFPDRVNAAATAGFDSIGLTLGQYRAALADGLDDTSMRALLDAHGLRLAELETPWDWAADGDDDSDDGEQLFHALEALGCPQLNAVQFAVHPYERLVERFAALCARTAAAGAQVALEFMPFSELPTVADAWRLVRDSRAANAGILLDSWHYWRSGGSRHDLAAVPPGRILSVQLNDALPTPGADLRHEARHLRLPPGEGTTAFVRLLRELGVTARMSAEVWSDELERLPPEMAAKRVHDATSRALAEAALPNH